MPPEKNHTAAPDARHLPLAAARALKPPAGALSSAVFEHGTLLLKLYAPRGKDEQLMCRSRYFQSNFHQVLCC